MTSPTYTFSADFSLVRDQIRDMIDNKRRDRYKY